MFAAGISYEQSWLILFTGSSRGAHMRYTLPHLRRSPSCSTLYYWRPVGGQRQNGTHSTDSLHFGPSSSSCLPLPKS
jgi:hypothetical protein